MGINEVSCPQVRHRSNFKVWIAIFIIVATIFNSVLVEKAVEDIKREQARYNLKQIKYCYSELYKTSLYGQSEIFDVCTNKMRTSFTGDVYILDSESLEFVHETSRDVPRNKAVYFTKESVGQYFKDWGSAEKALRQMLLGKNSEAGVNTYYKFDNDIEWLEWVYLPDEFSKSKRFIVVQGIQKDEIMSHLAPFKLSMAVTTVMLVMTLLVVNNVRRRSDDDNR